METLLAHLLDAAGRAPSAHNTQPWRLRWRGDALEVLIVGERTLAAGDPSGVDTLHGLGAMLENVVLTLAQHGFEAVYEVADAVRESSPVLVVRWTPASGPAPDPSLYRMIPVRRTSRLPYRSEPPAGAALEGMRAAVGSPCTLRVVTASDRIEEIRRLVARATALQLADAPIARELFAWMRFSPRDPRWYRDGLNAACMGLGTLEARVAGWLLSPSVLPVLSRLGLHRALCAIDQQAPRTPALCLLTVRGEGVRARIEAGRSLQRAWLTAAAHGLVTHPLSAAVDVPLTRRRVLELFDIGERELPVNLFRLGHSPPPARSARLPADEILESA